MKQIYLTGIIFVVLFTLSIRIANAGLPPTPSQETLNELKRLGDENLQKYGDGGVELINGEYVVVSKPTSIPPTSTPTATPLPTNTPTPTKPASTPAPQSVAVRFTKATQNIFTSIWHFFTGYFLTGKKK